MDLKEEIAQRLKDFERDTGLAVTFIDLERMDLPTGDTVLCGVEIEATLE